MTAPAVPRSATERSIVIGPQQIPETSNTEFAVFASADASADDNCVQSTGTPGTVVVVVSGTVVVVEVVVS
jgi:hypothetical protein